MYQIILSACVVFIVFALIMCAIADILVWILGPAIRRAGRCFEEGRIIAWNKNVDDSIRTLGKAEKRSPAASLDPIAKHFDDSRAETKEPVPVDAGHRWLGDTPRGQK